MVITFYGVRGSIPSPGETTVKYGGNTSCVHVELDNGHSLILDAGTGIRKLGKLIEKDDSTVNILLSHGHWDHIQGFPFFAPLYRQDRQIRVYTSPAGEHNKLCSLFDQIDGANFPVHVNDLPSQSECIMDNIESMLADKDIDVPPSTTRAAAVPTASRRMAHPAPISPTTSSNRQARSRLPTMSGLPSVAMWTC
jgi:ribonuclease BN (tRNA processing enzyme)